MAVPASPATAVAGPLAASLLNSYKTNIDWVIQNTGANRPYCYAYQSTGQTLSAGVLTAINLQSEIKDTDSMHTGTNGFFTVNTAGLYLVLAQVNFPSTAAGHDTVLITQNGSSAAGVDPPFTASSHRYQASAYMQCAATDTIGLSAQSSSGGLLVTGSAATFLQAFWMSL